MNRIGEILLELSEINKQAQNIQSSAQGLDTRRQELTLEWQGICKHPEEYVDEEHREQVIDTICRACSKILSSVQISGDK